MTSPYVLAADFFLLGVIAGLFIAALIVVVGRK